ncbi:MAG: Mth938-like domain-containing protein [Candidatus Bathyarchaeales archaeon]
MIDSYDFGVIVINGKSYTSDVIVFPEKVLDGWWRREGHKICLEDLREVLSYETKPEVLVIGTGYYGMVKILPGVKEALKSHGITLIAQQTREACQTFNKLSKSKKRVVGAFHLTC